MPRPLLGTTTASRFMLLASTAHICLTAGKKSVFFNKKQVWMFFLNKNVFVLCFLLAWQMPRFRVARFHGLRVLTHAVGVDVIYFYRFFTRK